MYRCPISPTEAVTKPTLLIAEGEPELCEIYQRFITERGYDLETASDGLDCLAKLRRTLPAAVVLDLELQWGGGNGVLGWLREEKATSGVPVILTATAAYPLDSVRDIEPPVVGFLHKPFSLTALLESVRSAVAMGQAARKAERGFAWSELYLG
jgi:two-component system phosphate regulon response regulator PhoB